MDRLHSTCASSASQPAVDPPSADLVVLADGTPVTIRPLQTGDRASILELFARLSSESRQRRFFMPKPDLSAREVGYLADVDHVSREALAATDARDSSVVGVARYAQIWQDPQAADMAIAVADEFQAMGIGTALAARLVQRARANRLERLTATTLWENRPARALLRRLGFRARASQGSELELELLLAPVV